MRKTLVLASLMLALLTLTALMPVVKAATTYYWDGVQFVDIKYPHPDRDYYGISPYSEWRVRANQLYHNQIDQAQSLALELTAIALGTAIGVIIGVLIPQPYGAVVGGITGIVLSASITYVFEVFLFDELRCIWWWISNCFVDWLIANLDWLGPLCVYNPAGAYTQILIGFQSYGYLRVGMVTFYDALGIGDPWYINYPPWDINQDGNCNILDLSAVGRALGTDDTYPWGTGWDQYNPDADINDDRQIDIDDLTIVAFHYGEEY